MLDLPDKSQRCKYLQFENKLGNSDYRDNPFGILLTILSPIFRKIQNLLVVNLLTHILMRIFQVLPKWCSAALLAKSVQWWKLDKCNRNMFHSQQRNTKLYISENQHSRFIFLWTLNYGLFTCDGSISSTSSQTGSH